MALGDGARAHVRRRVAATVALAQNVAGRAEAEMKSLARWTDRSGLSRAGLRGEAEVTHSGDRTQVAVVLSHSMGYGKWLETVNGPAMGSRAGMSMAQLEERGNAGNYAVIHPVADRVGPIFLRNAKRLWSRGAL